MAQKKAPKKKKTKSHFAATDPKAKIHTSRRGTCENTSPDEKPAWSKPGQPEKDDDATETCNFRSNCPAMEKNPYNAHHVLPVSSVNGYTGDPTYKEWIVDINAVYRPAEWCINKGPNMIGLPLKRTFLEPEPGSGKPSKGDPSWSEYPAHDVDHNCKSGYTDEVAGEIANKIWNKIDKVKPEAKAEKKHFKPGEVAAEFGALEKHFREQLLVRGTRKLGNKVAGGSKKSLAYSMATTAVAKLNEFKSL